MFGEHTSDLDSQLSLVIFTLTPSASYQFTGVEMEAESGAHGHTSSKFKRKSHRMSDNCTYKVFKLKSVYNY